MVNSNSKKNNATNLRSDDTVGCCTVLYRTWHGKVHENEVVLVAIVLHHLHRLLAVLRHVALDLARPEDHLEHLAVGLCVVHNEEPTPSTRTRTDTCTCTRTHTCIRISATPDPDIRCGSSCTYPRTYTYIYTDTCTCTYICTYTCTYIYTCTSTLQSRRHPAHKVEFNRPTLVRLWARRP